MRFFMWMTLLIRFAIWVGVYPFDTEDTDADDDFPDTIQSELCKKDLDILAKAKVAEEAIVRKAGGKFKMLPLFDETTAKIKAVCDMAVRMTV